MAADVVIINSKLRGSWSFPKKQLVSVRKLAQQVLWNCLVFCTKPVPARLVLLEEFE